MTWLTTLAISNWRGYFAVLVSSSPPWRRGAARTVWQYVDVLAPSLLSQYFTHDSSSWCVMSPGTRCWCIVGVSCSTNSLHQHHYKSRTAERTEHCYHCWSISWRCRCCHCDQYDKHLGHCLSPLISSRSAYLWSLFRLMFYSVTGERVCINNYCLGKQAGKNIPKVL